MREDQPVVSLELDASKLSCRRLTIDRGIAHLVLKTRYFGVFRDGSREAKSICAAEAWVDNVSQNTYERGLAKLFSAERRWTMRFVPGVFMLRPRPCGVDG